jgi:hypothetical protein
MQSVSLLTCNRVLTGDSGCQGHITSKALSASMTLGDTLSQAELNLLSPVFSPAPEVIVDKNICRLQIPCEYMIYIQAGQNRDFRSHVIMALLNAQTMKKGSFSASLSLQITQLKG